MTTRSSRPAAGGLSPHAFEQAHAAAWNELAAGLDTIERGRRRAGRRWPWRRRGSDVAAGTPPGSAPAATADAPDAARVAALYRQACEHLALARDRAYPLHLVERLESLTSRGHAAIYRHEGGDLSTLRRLVAHDVPAAVRAMRRTVLATAFVFLAALAGAGFAAWHDPHFILHVADAGTVRSFERMYGDGAEHLGRTAGDDWSMFGFYVMHNVGIAFQCFAAGLTLGVGPLLVVLSNGVQIGGVAGYLVARGHGLNFFSFVVTHGAFELTALVLSGACGMRLGLSMLMPGRLTRAQALRAAAATTAPVVYGLAGMLVVAAALEAFWSSATWIAPSVKFGAAAGCWALVIGWLTRAPRRDAARAR